MSKLVFSLLVSTLLALSGLSLGAQSNERIDELLGQSEVRLDSASYIILAASGLISETESPETAFNELKKLGFMANKSDPAVSVNVEELSYLLMKAFDLKAGVMYFLFPGPRYAYRSMAGAGVVIDAGGPYRLVSGEEVLRSLRYAMELKAGPQ